MTRSELTLLAAIPLLLAACADTQRGSPRENWSKDFSSRSPPTPECPGGTVSALRSHMAVVGPMSRDEAGARLAALGLGELASGDEVYSFNFATDPSAPGYWGFSGHLVANSDCILRVGKLGYDN